MTATFTGLLVVDITSNDDGLAEFVVYAEFDDPMNIVIGVNLGYVSSTTGFFHNSIGGAMQSVLPYTSAMNAISDNPDADSFVTIGLMTGDMNATMVTPGFDADGLINGTGFSGDGEGWFNADPSNGQGIPDALGRVLIAVFTPLNDVNGEPGIVSGEFTVAYDLPGPGIEFGTASFVTPAPGSLALLGLAALRGPRRRRE